MFSADSPCVSCGCFRQTPQYGLSGCLRQTSRVYLVVVFDRLLRRYRATSPNLGKEPIYLTLKRL
ncbi:MAG: hypothetical protein LUD00_00160 [Prevotellaceae bacterium]|nr:hypothetical protein [Prevotellaceae bacterium]